MTAQFSQGYLEANRDRIIELEERIRKTETKAVRNLARKMKRRKVAKAKKARR